MTRAVIADVKPSVQTEFVFRLNVDVADPVSVAAFAKVQRQLTNVCAQPLAGFQTRKCSHRGAQLAHFIGRRKRDALIFGSGSCPAKQRPWKTAVGWAA